ncbi:MAG: DUF1223 domain-containing protein [Hyphomonadaceae bacterium]
MRLALPALAGAAAAALAIGGLVVVSGLGRSFAEPATDGAVVVELFTSQSCSSCPPAEALFHEFASQDDLIALEWHVDYWDRLQTAAGAWKDPYSSSAWTDRQRAYNQRIRGRSQVYTPQAVIDGAAETVGFDKDAINGLVRRQRSARGAVRIGVTATAAGLSFDVKGAPADAELYLATFKLEASTRVGGGENNGRSLRSAHLVTALKKLDGKSPKAALPAAGYGCALIVQEPGQGRILAGQYCPQARSS